MAHLFVVVEKMEDWRPFYASMTVLTVDDYLNLPIKDTDRAVQVINLCHNYKYLSKGYYCSLLAEACNHRVIPSVRSINDISKKSLYSLDVVDLGHLIENSQIFSKHGNSDSIEISIYFGLTEDDPSFRSLARQLFEILPFPILTVRFKKEKKWIFDYIKYGSIQNLNDKEEDLFADSLNKFSKKIWRFKKSRTAFRYDLAILHNPSEAFPPSNKEALNQFIRAGKDLKINVELIEKKDYNHMAEYDALFIREQTALNHHTYQFAKKAENEGLIVIDDPRSILKCTNKVYLSRLLESQKINTLKTTILDRDKLQDLEKTAAYFQYPMVLKIPDGSFSIGIVKIESEEDLIKNAKEFFKHSALILAQEYCYTDFDWRIGILNQKLLFACKYFMSKGHWQIYNHNKEQNDIASGESVALPLHQVPKNILNTALKAANLIGTGLYGVDLKEKDGQAIVIEINENPSIDAGVEDAYLGEDLYIKIMDEFLRRLTFRSSGVPFN